MRRTLTVILASDVAGYSRLVADREEETIRRFTAASTVFWDLVKKHQGTVFNTAGDAILAKFDSAVDAVRCAIDIQDANNAENAQLPDDQKMLFRIGIAIGDVLVAENGDLLGDAVNVAARLENLAEPGGICISDDVRSHVQNKIRLNVIDLGDQSLRNIPRAIRCYRVVVSQFELIAAPERGLRPKVAAARPTVWIAAGGAALGVLVLALAAWEFYPWSPGPPATAEERFDHTRIPLVNDRVRESLANYEKDPDHKSVSIAREGWGVAVGAVDVEAAKREALDRCSQRDQKGYCRIYAIGNKVVWSKPAFPLPEDVRAAPLDTPFTPDEIKLLSFAFNEQAFQNYLQRPDSKALAVNQNGYWWSSNHPDPAEAARLAVERCSDRFQSPCLLVSVNGRPTHKLPKTYLIPRPFTLAGETDMTDADKERIGKIYTGDDWRALARGILPRWYAVANMKSEEEAVAEVLKACRAVEKICFMHAIGNFRVGDKKD